MKSFQGLKHFTGSGYVRTYPKVYFLDPALAIFLSGYHDRDSLLKSRELGGYFETLVYLHLRALCEVTIPLFPLGLAKLLLTPLLGTFSLMEKRATFFSFIADSKLVLAPQKAAFCYLTQ